MTMTLGFDSEKPWPIFVGEEGAEKSIDMNPGDGIIYKGCELRHWREAFEGEHHAQVFMHYVDANGPYKDQIYDGRPGGLGTFTFADGKVSSHA
ncbi:MAG: hypothetical protein CL799_01165 [Chromatiales bacterium]|jgi:hypothetical protein|nr:hypothetical protein [Chromatiales bacterium]MDP6150793.1 hypothetical protein [Gammaproteobacteria bacterium]MDP7270739.1 hypothetical protein [Gammaproteobacteria bacterium]HJP03543.1 hypothetical protein [Gammaproteobacteria bacterium]